MTPAPLSLDDFVSGKILIEDYNIFFRWAASAAEEGVCLYL